MITLGLPPELLLFRSVLTKAWRPAFGRVWRLGGGVAFVVDFLSF